MTLVSRVGGQQTVHITFTYSFPLGEMHTIKYLQLPFSPMLPILAIPRWEVNISCVMEMMTNHFLRQKELMLKVKGM